MFVTKLFPHSITDLNISLKKEFAYRKLKLKPKSLCIVVVCDFNLDLKKNVVVL